MIYEARARFGDFEIAKEVEARNEYHATLDFFEDIYKLIGYAKSRDSLRKNLAIDSVIERDRP